MFQDKVLKARFECKAKNGYLEQSLADLTPIKLVGRVESIVSVEIVHALECDTLHQLIIKRELLFKQLVAGDVMEGR